MYNNKCNLLLNIIFAFADASVVDILLVTFPGGEGLLATEHLIQHAAQRPNVRLWPVGLVDHLRGEVLSRAPHLQCTSVHQQIKYTVENATVAAAETGRINTRDKYINMH